MITGILGKKLGSTQVFKEDGTLVPVTVIQAGPAVVLQKKSSDKDGYASLQVGFEAVKAHRVNKPLMGHFRKAGMGAFRYLREFPVGGEDEFQLGDQITCDQIFQEGDIVDVTGTSKGKGYQGVVKRWGFGGGRASHGAELHRTGGSIGASAYPSRVFKGKKMAGQTGNRRITTQNLEVVSINASDHIMLIKGTVPGPKNGMVIIRKGIKAKK
ncbi:MAG: 50S ribosomal protein L3 [Desulfuromonadaceae bacterium]|nr:50S ribosomal protein L3 [Desulfuromonadaceae bacterium]